MDYMLLTQLNQIEISTIENKKYGKSTYQNVCID